MQHFLKRNCTKEQNSSSKYAKASRQPGSHCIVLVIDLVSIDVVIVLRNSSFLVVFVVNCCANILESAEGAGKSLPASVHSTKDFSYVLSPPMNGEYSVLCTHCNCYFALFEICNFYGFKWVLCAYSASESILCISVKNWFFFTTRVYFSKNFFLSIWLACFLVFLPLSFYNLT